MMGWEPAVIPPVKEEYQRAKTACLWHKCLYNVSCLSRFYYVDIVFIYFYIYLHVNNSIKHVKTIQESVQHWRTQTLAWGEGMRSLATAVPRLTLNIMFLNYLSVHLRYLCLVEVRQDLTMKTSPCKYYNPRKMCIGHLLLFLLIAIINMPDFSSTNILWAHQPRASSVPSLLVCHSSNASCCVKTDLKLISLPWWHRTGS